ncbi:hypothetical protein INR49_007216 [Caranx melampygus]|nr:hypothetical protein INR49_007216 [Caranx melampygus]
MHQWDLFTVSPAAALLAGGHRLHLFQTEPAFSCHLNEAVQRVRVQRQLDQVQLEAELLQVEKQSADVTHTFHLCRRFQMLQMFCGHLQELLKDQNSLRQRLMRPLGRTNLPIQAHLHRSVVEVVQMLRTSWRPWRRSWIRSTALSPAERASNSSLVQLLAGDGGSQFVQSGSSVEGGLGRQSDAVTSDPLPSSSSSWTDKPGCVSETCSYILNEFNSNMDLEQIDR